MVSQAFPFFPLTHSPPPVSALTHPHPLQHTQAIMLEAASLARENELIEGEIQRIRAHIDELSNDKEGTKAEVQRLLSMLREKEARLRLQ